MSQQRNVKRYTKGFIWLHWGIALVVLPMVTCSFFLEDFPKTIRPTAIMLHKSFGLSILVLMLIRLIYLMKQRRPSLPSKMPKWEIYLARVVQASLYFFLIAMAFAGWLMSSLSNHAPVWFGLIRLPFPGLSKNIEWADWFFQAHKTTAWILLFLIGLHIAGALKHAIIDKDKVLENMLP